MQVHKTLSNMAWVSMLLSMTLSNPLAAAPGDMVQPYIAGSVTYDDNLLRISGDTDPVVATGQSSISDTLKRSTLGLKIDWKQSRQQLIFDAAIHETRFSRFTSLNYQGKDMLARWNWQLGNSLSGAAGYTKKTTLGSFAEKQRLVNNIGTQQQQFFNSAWQVLSNWRVAGGASRNTYRDQSTPTLDNVITSYDAAVIFMPRSGNEFGLRQFHITGKYKVPEIFSGVAVDNGYSQDQLLATMDWLYSGHIRVTGQAGVVSRTHNQVSARDFSGNTMRATVNWFTSGKSRIELGLWNEIDAYDDLTTSFTENKGSSLGASWELSSKFSVSALLKRSKREFLGDPGMVLAPQATRVDTVKSSSLSLAYQTSSAINISATVQAEKRSSNRAFIDYQANTYNLSASFRF